jgi:hypothetical protein
MPLLSFAQVVVDDLALANHPVRHRAERPDAVSRYLDLINELLMRHSRWSEREHQDELSGYAPDLGGLPLSRS